MADTTTDTTTSAKDASADTLTAGSAANSALNTALFSYVMSQYPEVPQELWDALESQAGTATRMGEWWENEMYPWYSSAVESSNNTYQSIIDNALEDADWYRNWTKDYMQQASDIRDAYYQNWQNNYLPIEQNLIDEANNYNSDAYREQQAQLAMGDIAAAYANQRQQMAINMSKYGVDPTSGQYMGQMNALGVNQAAATAAAMNSARQAAVELGWEKNMALAELGLNYVNATNTATSGINNTVATGSGATNQAESTANTSNAGITTNLNNLATTGINSYQTLANAWGNVASGYNTLYGNEINGWSALSKYVNNYGSSSASASGGSSGSSASNSSSGSSSSGLSGLVSGVSSAVKTVGSLF